MNATGDHRIEIRLREISQLFNSTDPSPFIDRGLDAAAEELIMSWARELTHTGDLELVIHLTTLPPEDRGADTEAAVRQYFVSREVLKRRELRLLLRRGRSSMLIGLFFLAVCFGLGEVAQRMLGKGWNEFVELGLHIVGWVAMWRPLEIFLYDWWPVQSDQRLLERLGRMTVRLVVPPA